MSNLPGSERALVPAAPTGGELTLRDMGKVFAESGYFADARQAAQAVVKILFGRELGFGPTASMTGVYLVKGRPSLSANMMLAAIMRSKMYRYQILKLDNQRCDIRFFRRESVGSQWEEMGVSTFTMEDAKTAGLLANETWKKYPRNMLFARAVSNAARFFCADVFAGFTPYTPDEIDSAARADSEGNYVPSPTVEVVSVSPASPPQPFSGWSDESPLRDEFRRLLEKTGTPVERVLSHYGVQSESELAGEDLDAAVRLLRIKASV